MKKILAILALATGSAFAADYASIDVDHVVSKGGYASSQAQYVRVGKEVAGLQLGVQSRTSVSENGGMYNSLETTVGKSVAGFTPFVGMGHDNGSASAQSYNYGLVGATTGMKVGPGFALAGFKTRVGSDEATRTKQTVTFVSYSVPVAKDVAVNVGASRSAQDIKERGASIGVSFGF